MWKISPVVKQFLAISCCNLLTLSYGISSGWATINLLELENENSTFATGPLTQDESSLVVSIPFMGAFVGNYIALPIGRLIGIKRTIHMFAIPLILGTILTIWAQNVYFLFASRFCIGSVGGVLSVAIPTLVNDISYDNVRGALNALYDPFNNLGVIISFVLGNFLNCLDQAKAQLILPILFIVILFALPEPPDFWNQRNKEKKAIKSNRFYKGSIFALNQTGFLPVAQSEKNGQIEIIYDKYSDDSNAPITFADFCTPHAKRALLVTFPSLLLSYFSGTLSIICYTTYIFRETGSSLTEKDSSILISIVTLAANVTFLNIVERFNRRTLYIWSSLISTVSFFVFFAYGTYWHNVPGYEWMPSFCIACIVYFSYMGLLPIPYMITIEIFPKKIRQSCLAVAVSMLWMVLFILGATFFDFVKLFGLFNFMFIFGVICFLNGLFGIFFLPETRGKSYEQIEKMMSA